jgi:cysteinyl-tRNA synthetase
MSTLKIYNSLTDQEDVFKPIVQGRIGIYVCGITVYDYCHIGHARSLIVFDVIVRYLRALGFSVNFVRNITDVDDKIIQRALENQESCDALTERFIQAMHEDEKQLGILPPDVEPRATQHISDIIRVIEQLIAANAAYVAPNGDVCFSVREFKEYGKLSKRDIEKLISGARVSVGEQKRDPLDFVLWKLSKPGEPTWDSPWGKGRPGWHIECSAMSTEILGQPFDIHGGGMDLKFPHHENEIAQSEAACGKPFANIWMHAGLLLINKEKMSKSLGNFLTIREVLKEHHPEVIRYFMISAHYRSPVNYSDETLAQVRSSLERLYTAMRGLPEVENARILAYEDAFQSAMNDDFNTPVALSVFFDMAHEIHRLREQNLVNEAAILASGLKRLAGIFHILQANPEEFLRGNMPEEEVAKIEALIAERQSARANKNFARADEIRQELLAMGVVIEDAAAGTSWRKS